MARHGIYQKLERFLIKSFVYICKGLVLVHRHFLKPRNVSGKRFSKITQKTIPTNSCWISVHFYSTFWAFFSEFYVRFFSGFLFLSGQKLINFLKSESGKLNRILKNSFCQRFKKLLPKNETGKVFDECRNWKIWNKKVVVEKQNLKSVWRMQKLEKLKIEK